MVDGHQFLPSGKIYSSSRSQCIPFTDASHYGLGAHLEPMRLSFPGRLMEDQSQLHINILEIMAIRFALKKAMCHDFYWQYNSGLLYQQTRRNTFPQPMLGGYWKFSIGAWIMILLSEFIIFQAKSIYWQTDLWDWTDLSKHIGLWISRWWIPFFKCSISPVWICLQNDSITNSPCMYLQFWTVKL